jgi:hypothetical protein
VTAMIRFADARKERAVLRDKFDLFLGIVATIEVWVGSKPLYREEMFPIVELRAALGRWLTGSFAACRDFEFRSMESDEEGLIWLRRTDSGWRIGSIHQEFPAMTELTDEEVDSLARKFIEDVDQWVLQNCNIRVSSLL